MRRVLQAIPNNSSNYNNITNKPIYTRFHRKPQIYPNNYPANRGYKVEKNMEEENMNNYISNIYKEKKYRSILDPAAPNNKNIFIDTDSEPQKSEGEEGEMYKKKEKKSAKLLIAKTESQYPETFNSQNVFRRDGLTKGYFVKVNEDNNLNYNNYDNYNNYNTLSKNIMNTPSQYDENKYTYNKNKMAQTQIKAQKFDINNNLNQTYNRNTLNNGYFKKEIDLDDWPSIERNQKSKLYYRNKDIQINDKQMRNDNVEYEQYQNKNNYYNSQKNKMPVGIIYRKGNISDIKNSYSKSNISDSEDNYNQIRKQNEYNYIISGNSGIASPIEYKNNNNYIIGTSEEDSEHQVDFYGDKDYQNYMNKRIIKGDINNDMLENEHGGRINLNYGVKNNTKNTYKDNRYRNKNIMIKKKKNANIIDVIKNDENKLNALTKLQRFIKSYLYLRELCAMKIQAVWRGGNTRKIMELYNDLDEFIYHLSKVQFNHFNNNFCFFIKQLFNIYKSNISNENYDIEYNENNKEDDIDNDNENENCMNQISLEDIEKKEGTGSYFAPEKLELENEIALFVEGSTPYYERKKEAISKENEEANNINIDINNQILPKKEKNESESTIGSHKYHRISNIIKRNIEKKQKLGDNGTLSNDYDADLDINRDDDYFNHDISYDDKDNSGSLIKDKRYSYFSIHSDENSKYFDNENPNEKENKEGDMYKINTSKNSSKYNNNSTKNTGITGYTGYSLQDKSKLIGFRTDKINKNEFSNSPSVEKSNNYIGHHSKTFPRKYKNYNEYINTTALIIPKHEEDFNIINNKMFLSPKVNGDQKHVINARSDIAVTPNMKFEDKNWNEIIEYIKNEEIEIPTQKNLRNIKNKKEPKKFDILENEKINDINIDNKEYKNKKLKQIYVWHENELNIGKNKNLKKEKENLLQSIKDKENQIDLFKKQLEEIMNKINKPKAFDSKLEIKNNLNSLNIKGKQKDLVFKKINNQEININRIPRKRISLISRNNEFCINEVIPETVEEHTDTSDLIPKQIKITTKKIVKKTDTIQYKFKNTLISSENDINILGKEKLKPIFEEESQENNRFTIQNIIKDKKEDINQEIIDNKVNELLRVRILNPEDLKITNTLSYIFSPAELGQKKDELKSNEDFKVIKNNVISLNPEVKREIKLVTKKILKKTNVIHSKFNNDKTQISLPNSLEIKGIEKEKEIEKENQPKIELLSSEIEKLIKEEKLDQLTPELKNKIKIFVVSKDKDIKEITKENTININGTPKKFDNIQLPNEQDKNDTRFSFDNEIPNMQTGYKMEKPKKYENVINKKSKFTINSTKKKPEENIINQKAKFTINGIEKKPIELKEEGIQFERSNYLTEKMTDTNDLIPKEIKIVTRKTVKKTNILKKNINNVITSVDQIKIDGIPIPEKEKEKEKEKEEKENIKTDSTIKKEEIVKNKDWNSSLKKDGQQYNFVIKRISKNIYQQYKNLKKEKEKEKEKIKQDNKGTNIDKLPEENINKEIKEEQKLKPKKENLIKDNIIVKKINFNIIGKEDISKNKIENEPQLLPKENIIYQSNWKDLLQEDIQQNKFIIKGDKAIKAKLKELEAIQKKEANKPENDIDKNIEINIEPINTLHLAKEKIMNNWKESISQDKSEDLKIKSEPKKREIKISSKKVTKKTNFLYKRFGDNLEISKSELGIEASKKTKKVECADYLTEKIHININKAYERKIRNDLEIEKIRGLFINAKEYKKKEIKINTKKTVAKTNFVYKRFNHNLISNENQISIESVKPKSTIISSFGNEKLEKVEIEDNKFTINKTEDKQKEKELRDILQKEAENQIKIKLLEESKEIQNKIMNENEELKKENEELKNKLNNENILNQENQEKPEIEEIKYNLEPNAVEEFTIYKEYNNKDETLENITPLAIDDFTLEKVYNKENEENEENKENEDFKENKVSNEPITVEDFTIEKEDKKINCENYSLDNVNFSINKIPKEICEQGIQIEEKKPEKKEKTTDTFDLEKREIKITSRKILKKTNVLRHEFKNNSICPDTKININKPSDLLKERNNIINKIKYFTINKQEKENEIKDESKKDNKNVLEMKKNEDIIIKRQNIKNINNNIIDKITNIQLSNDQLQKPKEEITEGTFGDTYQLSNVKLHNKPIKKIADKNKSASYDILTKDNVDTNENEKSDEEQKKIYKKNKEMNIKLIKGPNKKKNFENLIIKLDNKSDVTNCFNQWNNISPNDTEKNKSLNIKQVMKDKDKKNINLNNIDTNERNTDTTNKEKSNEDYNSIQMASNNFDTINVEDKNMSSLDHISSYNITDENENNQNKKLKIKNDLNINIPDDNNNNAIYENNENQEENNDNNINTIGSMDENIYTHFNSISNDLSSSIEINDKNSDKEEQENIEKEDKPDKSDIPEKPEEPKKKEIIINKKICIISKKAKKTKIKYAEAKKKFFQKRFLIKFWKLWKKNADMNKKAKNIIEDNIKKSEQKKTKRPFASRIRKLPKRIIYTGKIKKENEKEIEKYIALKSKIMGQNKMLIVRHFFQNWKNDKKQQKEIENISVIENILRRYIVRYLVMQGKIRKFKTLLIKLALSRHK